jgi:hypothetical protein
MSAEKKDKPPSRAPGAAVEMAKAVAQNELLELAIAAQGGRDHYRGVNEIVIRAYGGGLAQRKHYGRIIGDFETRISTRSQRAEFMNYPRSGQRGVFEGSSVRIESMDDGSLLAERQNPRAKFPGGRRWLWWDHLDFLYFAGYAMWGYACAPFLFEWPDVEVREIEPWEEEDQTWRRLEVTYPETLHVHCRRQVYYFDPEGLLRRNDYTAEINGNFAKSAHYAAEHREFGGLVFPTRRRVFGRKRNNQPRRHPVLVAIDIAEMQVE